MAFAKPLVSAAGKTGMVSGTVYKMIKINIICVHSSSDNRPPLGKALMIDVEVDLVTMPMTSGQTSLSD